MKKLQGILCLALLVLAPAAKADFIVEPSIGYDLGSVSQNPSTTGSANGLALGAKLGMDFASMFFFGLDTHFAFPTWKIDTPLASNSASHIAFGLAGSVKIPALPLRFLLSYYFMNNMSVTGNAAGGGDTKYSGNAIKFGLGYEVLPMLCVNIDYTLSSFGTSEVAAVSTTLTNSISDKAFGFSVSAPITLPF